MSHVPNVPYRSSAVLLLAAAMLFAGCQPETESASDASLVPAANAATPSPPVELDPSRGAEIGMVFEAYLSPWQEAGEEDETPEHAAAFASTTPSKTRAEREAAGHRGHAKVRFTKDLSRAYVDVQIEGAKVSEINMFHLHCGVPTILGPILVDFALATDLQENFGEDGRFSVEVTNELIVETADAGEEGGSGAVTMGCLTGSPSLHALKPSKVKTVAGMAHIMLQGELYLNLHTTGQSYFGDMRGQLHEVD